MKLLQALIVLISMSFLLPKSIWAEDYKDKYLSALEKNEELREQITKLNSRIKQLERELEQAKKGGSSNGGDGGFLARSVKVTGLGSFVLKEVELDGSNLKCSFKVIPSQDVEFSIYLDRRGQTGTKAYDSDGDEYTATKATLGAGKSNRHYVVTKATKGIPFNASVTFSGLSTSTKKMALIQFGGVVSGKRYKVSMRDVPIIAN